MTNTTDKPKKKREEGSKREWIKTVAIIFLSIMLVLTFFSNTIMNYSLPQVSTSYVQTDVISAKIRVSGTVKSTDPYEVIPSETRVVTSVKVSVGDTVEKGDVLFELEDTESDELTDARNELSSLELAYAQAVLTNGISVDTRNKIEAGEIETLTEMQTTLSGYKASVDSYQTAINGYNLTVASYNAQLNALQYTDTSAEYTAVVNGKDTVAAANTAKDTAETNLTVATTARDEAKANYDAAVTAKSVYDSAVAQRIKAEAAVTLAQNNFDSSSQSDPDYAEKVEALSVAQAALSEAQQTEASAKTDLERYGNITDLSNAYNTATSSYNTALSTYNTALVAQSNANNALSIAQDALSKKEDVTIEVQTLNRQLSATNAALATAQLNLATAEENYAKMQKFYSDELTLENQYNQILAVQAKVEALEENAVGATITAPVSGTISTISVIAGEKMQAQTSIATITPAGKDKTVTVTVTAEQASKVKVGDVAEPNNGWYYGDMNIVLSQIRPSQTTPGSKELVFTVTGDVDAGTTLDLAVGDKSSTYDYVVPLSSVREDKDGKYILIVNSKSSPLGNRYIAQRVDVAILAQDDTKAAIKADVESYSYVITTASKPVQSGDQVRFYE